MISKNKWWFQPFAFLLFATIVGHLPKVFSLLQKEDGHKLKGNLVLEMVKRPVFYWTESAPPKLRAAARHALETLSVMMVFLFYKLTHKILKN